MYNRRQVPRVTHPTGSEAPSGVAAPPWIALLIAPLIALAVTLFMVGVVGCTDVEVDPSEYGEAEAAIETTDTPGDLGRFRLFMVGGPMDRADSLNVAVRRVYAMRAAAVDDSTAIGVVDTTAAAGVVLNAEPQLHDLLQLQGETRAVLTQQTLPTGDYAGFVLYTGCTGEMGPTIVIEGVSRTLGPAPNCSEGIWVVHDFSVVAGDLTEITIAFDAEQSVVMGSQGRAILDPVVSALAEVPGSISSTVRPWGTMASAYLTPEGSVALSGEAATERSVAVAETTASGDFTLSEVPPGHYDLIVVAEGFQFGARYGVEVVSGRDLWLPEMTLQPAP